MFCAKYIYINKVLNTIIIYDIIKKTLFIDTNYNKELRYEKNKKILSDDCNIMFFHVHTDTRTY